MLGFCTTHLILRVLPLRIAGNDAVASDTRNVAENKDTKATAATATAAAMAAAAAAAASAAAASAAAAAEEERQDKRRLPNGRPGVHRTVRKAREDVQVVLSWWTEQFSQFTRTNLPAAKATNQKVAAAVPACGV
jgi:hypothetical protein